MAGDRRGQMRVGMRTRLSRGEEGGGLGEENEGGRTRTRGERDERTGSMAHLIATVSVQ
jgi:hypothetical protein